MITFGFHCTGIGVFDGRVLPFKLKSERPHCPEYVQWFKACNSARDAELTRDEVIRVCTGNHAYVTGAYDAIDSCLSTGEQRLHYRCGELQEREHAEIAKTLLFSLQKRGGNRGGSGLEADSGKDNEARRVFSGQLQCIKCGIDNPDITTPCANLLQACGAARYTNQVAVCGGDDSPFKGEACGPVYIAGRRNADGAARAGRERDGLREQVAYAVSQYRVSMTAAELHEGGCPGRRIRYRMDETAGEVWVLELVNESH